MQAGVQVLPPVQPVKTAPVVNTVMREAPAAYVPLPGQNHGKQWVNRPAKKILILHSARLLPKNVQDARAKQLLRDTAGSTAINKRYIAFTKPYH